MMQIAIDFDSVMCNTMQQWCKELNKVVPEYLARNVDSLSFCSMELNYPTLLNKQIWAPLLRPDFWLSVQPLDGAVEAVKNLKKAGHDIFVVMSTRFDCCTCGKPIHIETFEDCYAVFGHYFSRSQHPGLKFHPNNIFAQCPICNMNFSSSVEAAYKQYMIYRFGEDINKQLLQDEKQGKFRDINETKN